MKIDKETEEKVREMQILEQNLQGLLMQKQAFQLELNETINANEALQSSKGDVYRIVGQIMLKSEKKEMEKDIDEKKHLLELRIKSIEKQETELRASLERLRNFIIEKAQ